MDYFLKNEEIVEKYLISFNKEKIEQLKEKIIDECSFIEHKEFSSDYFPTFSNKKLIRNLKEIKVGDKEYFEETRAVYLYSFDQYEPPYLVKLIDRLLNNDEKCIREILNYDIYAKISIDDKIKLANQELMKINAEDIYQKKIKLKELEDLVKTKELNKEQQNIEPYYKQLIGLIKFDLVDSMSIDDLNRTIIFLGLESSPSPIQVDNLQNSDRGLSSKIILLIDKKL